MILHHLKLTCQLFEISVSKSAPMTAWPQLSCCNIALYDIPTLVLQIVESCSKNTIKSIRWCKQVLIQKVTFSTNKKLLTQADTQPCVKTETSMSRQDNLASQERIVVNGRHCVDTEKSLCTQGNGCVNTTQHCLIGVHIGFVHWYMFSCIRLCQELFFSWERYFLNKNMFVVFWYKVKSLHHPILYHVKVWWHCQFLHPKTRQKTDVHWWGQKLTSCKRITYVNYKL